MLKKYADRLLPWEKTHYYIQRRIYQKSNPRYSRYGGRGIKTDITKEQLKYLWFRDKAYEMKKPSIDRIDIDGNYTLKNCRYIEYNRNSANKKRPAICKNGLHQMTDENTKITYLTRNKKKIELSSCSACLNAARVRKNIRQLRNKRLRSLSPESVVEGS